MQNNTVVPRNKSHLNIVIMVVFGLVVLGLVFWNLPRGYSADLSQIGKGKNIMVMVHDHYLVDSTRLMENLDRLRADYAGVVEFVVADMQVAEGQAFAKAHDVGATTLVFFSPDGTVLGSVQGLRAIDTLRATLNQVFHLSTPDSVDAHSGRR
jgi:thioredoxin-like negative regulator of GroEL